MWERGERKQELEAAECAMRRREIIEHMWNGYSEMRERERKNGEKY
jgi:hypothetical protein